MQTDREKRSFFLDAQVFHVDIETYLKHLIYEKGQEKSTSTRKDADNEDNIEGDANSAQLKCENRINERRN